MSTHAVAGETILVVDAGGGTTDMALMKVEAKEGLAKLAEATYRRGVSSTWPGAHCEGLGHYVSTNLIALVRFTLIGMATLPDRDCVSI